jgi:hypothetical protein
MVKTHIANEVPFMLLFLNEIYHKGEAPELKAPLQLVANHIIRSQRANGGWDYTYTNARHCHTATVIQNAFALAVLKKSGFKIPDSTFENALLFIRGREPWAKKKPGYMYYGDGTKRTPLETGVTNRAAGMLTMLHHLDLQSDPLWARCVCFYRKALSRRYIYGGHSPAYQHFMVATASRLLGPESWKTYLKVFGESHIKAQSRNGQWPTTNGRLDRSHPHGGIVFETAINCMLLQFPLGNLSFATKEAN